MIDGLSIFVVIIAIAALCLGFFLLLNEGRNRQKMLFACLNFFAAAWILANYFGSNTINKITQYLVIADYALGIILVLFFWLFILETRRNILGRTKAYSVKVVLPVIYTALLIVLIFLGYIVHVDVGTRLIISNEALYVAYPIGILLLASLGLKDLIVTIARARHRSDRKRLKLVIIGLSIALLCISVPNLILENLLPKGPLLEGAYNSAYLGVLVFLALSTYAIVRHGLFDVKLAAIRSAVYALSVITLAGMYYALAYFVSVALFQGHVSNTVSVSPVNVGLALILAFIFQPIKSFFDRITNDIFYRDRYDSNEFYARLSELLTSTTDLRQLMQRAATEIAMTLKSEQAFFFLQHDQTHRMTAGTKHHAGLPVADVEYFNTHIAGHEGNVVVTELLEERSHLRRLLVSHKIAMIMPLTRGDNLLGYFVLGEQRSVGYTKRDVRVLNTISDELVIAIQNALSVQEVKELNAHLQQRISAATSELRRTNARLRRLDTTKDEFLSMASHQLRTPLTSIKGYLSMVLDGDLGRVSSTQKKVLEEAFTSSERMVHLIHDFLNVSRLQTGRFVLELAEGDLSNLVKDEVDSLRRVAESRNMTIEYQDQAGPTPLVLDDTKLRQVVMNYIDNAIYYSKPDTAITVQLTKQDGNIVLKVHDTGIGVPLSEQPQLFEKFFRATNARKQRPDGTGVGLYLAKKVITAHGGDVLFSSKPGKGSTFGFKLPLIQDQALLEKNSTKQF
ncbi:MAG TPA: ATP-binding protein [Candidatus Saccharimonadales bacterium]